MQKYGKLTQGSIINNLRILKYPDDPFYGVIITARCDIANCKVSRFYYLLATPVEDWIMTEGVRLATERYYENQLTKVLDIWKDKLPDFDKVKTISQ